MHTYYTHYGTVSPLLPHALPQLTPPQNYYKGSSSRTNSRNSAAPAPSTQSLMEASKSHDPNPLSLEPEKRLYKSPSEQQQKGFQLQLRHPPHAHHRFTQAVFNAFTRHRERVTMFLPNSTTRLCGFQPRSCFRPFHPSTFLAQVSPRGPAINSLPCFLYPSPALHCNPTRDRWTPTRRLCASGSSCR